MANKFPRFGINHAILGNFSTGLVGENSRIISIHLYRYSLPRPNPPAFLADQIQPNRFQNFKKMIRNVKIFEKMKKRLLQKLMSSWICYGDS